jgi:hypothetical protein
MKTVFKLLFFYTSLPVFGQSYLPVPESDAVWIQGSFLYSAYNNHEHATITQPLSFVNDSLINGTVNHTLHGHAIADWIDGWGNPQTYQSGTDYLQDQIAAFFRQDLPNKRIYQWDPSANQEQLLYDFANLTVGQPYPQTLQNIHFPQLLVMAYDSIVLMDGLYHERWILGSNSTDSGFVSIIEGVGSTMGFNLPLSIPFEQSSALLCLSVNGSPLFDGWENANGLIPPRFSADCSVTVSTMEWNNNEWDLVVWPNPVNDMLFIQSGEQIEKLALYNLVGELVYEQSVPNLTDTQLSLRDLPSGVYQLSIFAEHNQITMKWIVH